MSKFLRYSLYLGFFIIPFIPLVVINSFFFPFITGKGFVFRILVELMFGIWVILAATEPKYRPKMSWIFWPLIAFMIVMFIADLHSIYPYKSFWSNYERMEGYVTLAHLFIFFIIASTVLRTTRLWNWFWVTNVGVSIIIALYGFLQLAGKLNINQGGVRLDATFGNATYLAVYTLFNIFITAYLMVSPNMFLLWPGTEKKEQKTIKLIVGVIIILFNAIILYKTATRGAMLGLIAGFGLAALIMALFARREEEKTLRKISIGVVIAAFVVVFGFLAVKNTSFVKNSEVLSRFSSISLKDPTTESRFILWNMAWQGFKERPLLGWGQESFNYVFNKYYDARLYNQEQWFDRTHNVFFDWLIAGGILGIATYLWFFGSIIWYTWKKTELNIAQKSVITGLLVAYFIHNLFVFDNLVSYILYFAIAAFIHSKIVVTPDSEERVYVSNRLILPVAIVGTLVLLYVINWNAVQANMILINAITPHTSSTSLPATANLPFGGNISQNITDYQKALAYKSFGTPEVREQLLSAADSVVDSSSQIQGGSDFITFAENQAAIQASTTPDDARYQLLAGALMNRLGNYNDAITYLTKAVSLSPSKQSIIFELGSAYIAAKDYKDAEAVLKHAYELEPTYQDAQLFYAVGAVYNSDTATANSLLQTLPQDVVINSDPLLYAYVAIGQNQTVLALWKARVAASPQDPQKHVSLAAAYLLNKDTSDAILEIRKAEALYPDFKDQGEAYVKEIQAGKTP